VIECKHCGKRHRTNELVEKCRARAERREKRDRKKAQDGRRRALNARRLQPVDLICEMRREEYAYNKIAARLKRDYPVRCPDCYPRGWDTISVIILHSPAHVWPEGATWPADHFSIGMLQEWYAKQVSLGVVASSIKESPPEQLVSRPEPKGLSEEDLRWWRFKEEKGWL
jgi:hypothetical protein